MNSIVVNCIGYAALAINLFSMSVKGEHKLRFISTIANLVYIVYGIFIGAYPIILGCSIAVLLHTYRLKALNAEKND